MNKGQKIFFCSIIRNYFRVLKWHILIRLECKVEMFRIGQPEKRIDILFKDIVKATFWDI